MSSDTQYKFKITLFGPGGVGKTSLLLRYIKDYFSDDLKKTIGSNFLIKDVEIDNKNVRLLLWDIGGQPQFHKLRTIYFKGSNAALGVFDLSSSQSLLKIPGWISSIKKTVKKAIPMLLLGNKVDLEREVDRLEAEDLAKKLSCE
ncbi:MAG: GTP-binding protein, partial [Candidatus Hermodarchaeota archaeon]